MSRKSLYLLALAALTGCGGAISPMDPGRVLGRDHVIGEPGPIPSAQEPNPPGGVPGPRPVIGDSCSDPADRGRVCLALKVVSYVDPDGWQVVDREEAVANVRAVNRLWAPCNLGFQIEQFLPVRAQEMGLAYRTADFGELDRIRASFGDGSTLLEVTTGAWDRSGSLGNTGANAWTSMPGGGPYGAVLEAPVGTYANIIGHELGHYLNLGHVDDGLYLMSPVIYVNSTRLTAAQCATARAAAAYFWARMYR